MLVLYKLISCMYATVSHYLQETGHGESSKRMVYKSHTYRQKDNIKMKPKISVSLVTLLTKVHEHSDRPIVGLGGHAQPTHIFRQAINLKYGASALSFAYQKWHRLELQSAQCDSFTCWCSYCVWHIMSMKWTQNVQHAVCLMHYKDTWS
jgi:hypothetical protein